MSLFNLPLHHKITMLCVLISACPVGDITLHTNSYSRESLVYIRAIQQSRLYLTLYPTESRNEDKLIDELQDAMEDVDHSDANNSIQSDLLTGRNPLHDAKKSQYTQQINLAKGAWGRLLHMANGNWLAICTEFPSPTTNILKIWMSDNDLQTWHPLSEVSVPGRKMDNGELFQLSNGHILLTCRSLIDNVSYELPVYESSDMGASWKYLSMVMENNSVMNGNNPSQGLWEPTLYQLPHDKIAVAYSTEMHSVASPAYSQICAFKVSSNNGASWGSEQVMVEEPGGGNLRPGMPVVRRMANGKYIEVSEIVGMNNAEVCYKISTDGIHWPDGLGTPIPHQHAGPYLIPLHDGRLVVTSCSNELSCSHDFGKTWELVQPPVWKLGFTHTYPAIYQVSSNSLAVITSHDGISLRLANINALPSDKPINK